MGDVIGVALVLGSFSLHIEESKTLDKNHQKKNKHNRKQPALMKCCPIYVKFKILKMNHILSFLAQLLVVILKVYKYAAKRDHFTLKPTHLPSKYFFNFLPSILTISMKVFVYSTNK